MWPRRQLFELIDQPWLPATLRRGETDYLAAAIAAGKPFHGLAPRIAALLERAGTERVIDLASGGAGPWPALRGEVARQRGGRAPAVTLTDLYPDPGAFARAARVGLDHAAHPVDARRVPAELSGIRTMFDGLHHLAPADARAVLADAHRAGAPILIGEAMSRRPRVLLGTLLIPLLVLLLTPTVRPWSLARLVLTYLVPILPLVIWWDGVVSCLRTYRPDELRALTAGLDGFVWEAGELRHRGAVITYLTGTPR